MVRPATPYVLTGIGLVVGLGVLVSEPLPTAGLNYLVGGAFLTVAVLSVAYMIIEGGGPGDRGPDF